MGYGVAHFNGGRLTYERAVEYLKPAKNKWDRPLHGKRNARIIWLGKGVEGHDSIALQLHSTTCVVIHADGTYTINMGGWNTHTTRAFVNAYSPVRLHSEKYQLKIQDVSLKYTPVKIGKCRRCKGEGNQRSENWYKQVFIDEYLQGQQKWTYERLDEPVVTYNKCWGCDGFGEKNYGSKPIYFDWDGDWLRIDANGNVLGAEPHWQVNKLYGYQKPQPQKKVKEEEYEFPTQSSYTPTPTYNVGGTLESLLPGLNASLNCPGGVEMGCHVQSIKNLVIHLNDSHKWTREEIADWLDTLDVDLRFPVSA